MALARVPSQRSPADHLGERERRGRRRPGDTRERYVWRQHRRELGAGVPAGDVDDEVRAVLGVEAQPGGADRGDHVVGDGLARRVWR